MQGRGNLGSHGNADVGDDPGAGAHVPRQAGRFGDAPTADVRLQPPGAAARQEWSQLVPRTIALAQSDRRADFSRQSGVFGRGFRSERALEPQGPAIVEFAAKAACRGPVKPPESVHRDGSLRTQGCAQAVDEIEQFCIRTVVEQLEDSKSRVPGLPGPLDPIRVRCAREPREVARNPALGGGK